MACPCVRPGRWHVSAWCSRKNRAGEKGLDEERLRLQDSRDRSGTDPCRPRHAVRRVDAPLLAARVPVPRPGRSSQAYPHPWRGSRGLPGRRRQAGAALLPLQPPGHFPGIREGRAGRTSLLLPRLALRRGGARPRHAAGATREHGEGPSLASCLPGKGVRRLGLRLHGTPGKDAGAAQIRRLDPRGREVPRQIRAAHRGLRRLQLAPNRGKPHGCAAHRVAAYASQRFPVSHPGVHLAAGGTPI